MSDGHGPRLRDLLGRPPAQKELRAAAVQRRDGHWAAKEAAETDPLRRVGIKFDHWRALHAQWMTWAQKSIDNARTNRERQTAVHRAEEVGRRHLADMVRVGQFLDADIAAMEARRQRGWR